VPRLPRIRGLPGTYWTLWAGTLLNRAGTFVVPFLALYLTGHRQYSAAAAGAVVSLYGAGSLIASFLGGTLADRLGRRRMMLASLVTQACAMLGLGFARSPFAIASATLAVGFLTTVGNPAIQAAIADLVPPADRPRAFGLLYWAVNVGFSIGILTAGLLAEHSFGILFAGDAATTLLFAIIVFLRVPETRPNNHDRPPALTISRVLAPYRDRALVAFLLAMLPLCVVGFQAAATLPLDLNAHAVSPHAFGLLMAINGVLIVLLQPFAVASIHRFRRGRVLALSGLLYGVGYGLNAIAHAIPVYVAGIVGWTAGEILLAPLGPTVVADLAPTDLRGTYQGAYSLVWASSSLLGPVLGSAVLQRFGGTVLWTSCLGAGGVSAAGHVFAARAVRRRLAQAPATAVASEVSARATSAG
jgi:MFS family permease